VTRLPEPDTATMPDDVRRLLAAFPPDPMVTMLSLATSTVQPFIGLARALATAVSLPQRARELAILVTATRTGAGFVWAQHVPISEAAGVEERVRDLIAAGRFDDPELTAEDRTVIALAAAVIDQPRVPDDLFAAASTVLGDREIVELLQICGFYWTFGRISTTLDVEVTEVYGTGGPVHGAQP
jgi:alkylhydroperoxidase family enzyme